MDERSRRSEPERGAPSGKPLIIGAVILVAAALGLLFSILPATHPPLPPRSAAPEEREPAAAEQPAPVRAAAPSPPASAPPPVRAQVPVLPTVDLFVGDVPELLRMGKEVIDRGTPIASHKLKEIFQYAKDHPGDARGYLLMGNDAMNRKWFGFAAEHYESAQNADPRARQDPRMLTDLVRIASEPEYASQGETLLARIYGRYAVTAVEDALAAADGRGDRATVDRLTALSARLAAAPAVP